MIFEAVCRTTYSNFGLKMASDESDEVPLLLSMVVDAVLSMRKLSSLLGMETITSISWSAGVCISVRIVRLCGVYATVMAAHGASF